MSKGNTNRQLIKLWKETRRTWAKKDKLVRPLEDACFMHVFLWAYFKYGKIYKEEFDPGSGWTLATGLTHASRAEQLRLFSGRRVSNTYPTFPLLGYSLGKLRVIPDEVYDKHFLHTKDLSVRGGDAFH